MNLCSRGLNVALVAQVFLPIQNTGILCTSFISLAWCDHTILALLFFYRCLPEAKNPEYVQDLVEIIMPEVSPYTRVLRLA